MLTPGAYSFEHCCNLDCLSIFLKSHFPFIISDLRTARYNSFVHSTFSSDFEEGSWIF